MGNIFPSMCMYIYIYTHINPVFAVLGRDPPAAKRRSIQICPSVHVVLCLFCVCPPLHPSRRRAAREQLDLASLRLGSLPATGWTERRCWSSQAASERLGPLPISRATPWRRKPLQLVLVAGPVQRSDPAWALCAASDALAVCGFLLLPPVMSTLCARTALKPKLASKPCLCAGKHHIDSEFQAHQHFLRQCKKWLSMLAKLDEKKLIARHPGSELLSNPSCKNCETMLSAKKTKRLCCSWFLFQCKSAICIK